MDDDSTFRLITEIEKWPVLYDKSHHDNKDSKHRESAWILISQQLGLNPKEVEKKWKGLRDTLVRYRRSSHGKLHINGIPSAGRKWKYGKAMAFLIPYLNPLESPEDQNDFSVIIHDVNDANHMMDEQANIHTSNVQSLDHHSENSFRAHPPKYKPYYFPNQMKTDNTLVDRHRSPSPSHALYKDEAQLFANSLVPILRRLTDKKRALAQIKLRQVLYNIEFEDEMNDMMVFNVCKTDDE